METVLARSQFLLTNGLARGCLGSGVALSTGKPGGSLRVVPLLSTATSGRRTQPTTTTSTKTTTKAPPPPSPTRHYTGVSYTTSTITITISNHRRHRRRIPSARHQYARQRLSIAPSDRERNIFFIFPRKDNNNTRRRYVYTLTHLQ